MATDVYPPDYSTPVGQIRLLLGDDDTPYVFSDDKIKAMLVIYKDSVLLTAAAFFDTIAQNTVLLYKVIKTDDLSVSGGEMSKVFTQRARDLRDEAAENAMEDSFDVVYPWNGKSVLDDTWGTPWGY